MLSQTTNGQVPTIDAVSKQPENLTTGFPRQEGAGIETLPPICESTSSGYQRSTTSRDKFLQRITTIKATPLPLLPEASAFSPPYEKPVMIHHRHEMWSQARSQARSRPPSGANGNIFYFVLRPIRSGCESDCPCCCHKPAPRNTSWALPSILEGLVGSLFVGYAGLPVRCLACDTDSCSKARTIKLQITYSFPIWFLRYALQALIIASTSGTLTVSLTVRQRMANEPGSAVSMVTKNEKDALRIKLEADRPLLLSTDIRYGRSLLHWSLSCFMPNVEIVKMLLQMGSDPDCEDDFGRTPRRVLAKCLLCNSFENNHEMAELETLLPISQGIDALGLTYIQKLVCGVYPIPLVPALENLGPRRVREEINEPNAEGWTALHLATLRHDTTAIKALLLAGINVDVQDIAGCTALILCANYGYEDCLDMLLGAGADVSLTNIQGSNALHFAAQNPALSIVKKLIASGLDPNQPSGYGDTAMSRAATFDQTEIIRYLHQQGANLDSGDSRGTPPLYYSLHRQTPDTGHESFALLLELGADHLVVDGFGYTLLHRIAEVDNVETMKIITEKKLSGLNVHAKNKAGNTPLEVFEQRSQTSDDLKKAFYRLLRSVEATVDLDAQDEKTDLCKKVELNGEEDQDEDGDIFEDALEKLDYEKAAAENLD